MSKQVESNAAIESTAADEPVINVCKIATCESLSGLSRIEYHVGYVPGSNDQIYLRLSRNIDGNGKFNTTWKSLASIAALIPAEADFTVSVFEPLYIGQSRNSHGFLAAALLAEGLIVRTEERKYRRNDATEWSREMQSLISADTNLDDPSMEKCSGHSGGVEDKGKPAKKKSAVALANPVG